MPRSAAAAELSALPIGLRICIIKTLSIGFKAATTVALAGWLMLFAFPLWPELASRLIPALAIFLLCAIYGYFVFLGRRHDALGEKIRGSFFSLAGVLSLFKSPRIVLAGWVHILAFDLLAGLYIVTDAARVGIPHAYLLPVLLLALMFGPAGLLAYLLLRMFWLPGGAAWLIF